MSTKALYHDAMNLQILSDLHLEFHGPHELEYIDSLDKSGVDVVVVAGDLCVGDFLRPAIETLCEQYREVVYVTGNHEYYRTSPGEVHRLLHALGGVLPNFHWLLNESVEIAGIRFAGTTLWFRDHPGNLAQEYAMNDFALIREFKPWVYWQNGQALEFLEKEAARADVVVTHHMPSVRCVLPQFEGDSTNCFFLCELDDLIQRAKPSLWIHGHTHDSIDVLVGETRVICNPLGYMPWHNQAFDEKLIVEVEPRS